MEDWILKSEERYRYMLLDRLRQDCEYFLRINATNLDLLWAGDKERQIQTMKDIWNSFSEEDKPEWLTWEDILDFERRLI